MDGMDQAALKSQKLDPSLRSILEEGTDQPISVIVQTIDGLKEEDRRTMGSLGGKIKDDLYIINAFSAEISAKSLEMLILSPRVTRIYHDAEVHANRAAN